MFGIWCISLTRTYETRRMERGSLEKETTEERYVGHPLRGYHNLFTVRR